MQAEASVMALADRLLDGGLIVFGCWAMSTITTVMTIASAVIGAATSYMSGQAQASAQKKSAEYNATVYRQNAVYAQQKADAEAADQRRQNARNLATARARGGGSGATPEGSPLMSLVDMAEEGEYQALKIQHGGDVEATGLLARAGMEDMKGSNVQGPNIATTLLTAGGKIVGAMGSGSTSTPVKSGGKYSPSDAELKHIYG